MPREFDPRAHEREQAEPTRGGRGGASPLDGDGPSTDLDPLTVELDLPRGPARERVHALGRDYRLSGRDVETMAAVGAFRVVPAHVLRPSVNRTLSRPARAIERLREDGLVRTTPFIVGRTRTTLVTLTDQGHALLERHQRPDGRQQFYAGIAKPRELAHDARVYEAYQKAAARVTDRGARVRRVVLEEQLKRDYQRFLHARPRQSRDDDGRPTQDIEAIATWAREQQLLCEDGHVAFPDVRLEIEEHDGRWTVEDLEVMTPHYRGAHAAGKVRAGFTRFRAVGARLGGTTGRARGGRVRDARLAEELLS
ncbi:MAG: hypothetical protein AB7U83_04975 [Vicinamibacterales bacterium]